MDTFKKWRFRLGLSGLLAIVAASAVGAFLFSRMYVTDAQLASLTRGMSHSEVIAIVGNPNATAHHAVGLKSSDYWQYQTFAGPVTVVFHDDKYADVRRKPTPNL